MKRSNLLWASLALFLSASVQADPSGDLRPLRPGRYETPWGPGNLSISMGRNVHLELDNRGVLWGILSEDGKEWSGRWIRKAETISPGGPEVRCTATRFAVPDSVVAPASPYWGSFSFRINEQGNWFSGPWSNCLGQPTSTLAQFRMTGRWLSAPVSSTAAGPRNLPCLGIGQTAIATLSPCHVGNFKPLKITMRRSLPANRRIDRVYFTPLVQDARAIRLAIQNNKVLPRDPRGRKVFQVIPRGVDLYMLGQRTEITPPGSACSHDYYEINLVDDAGAEYKDIGVIQMECGPGEFIVPGTEGVAELKFGS
jgi:hypothetical protein